MKHQLSFFPDLGLSPADAVAAWNASAKCRTITKANHSYSSNAQYDPLLVGALSVLSSLVLLCQFLSSRFHSSLVARASIWY
jgi:hypothetical protein